jgi:hypothetical protein
LWHLGFPYPQGNQGTPYPPQPYRPGYPPTSGYPPYPSPAQPSYPGYPPSSSGGYPPPATPGGYQQNTGYFSQVSCRFCVVGGGEGSSFVEEEEGRKHPPNSGSCHLNWKESSQNCQHLHRNLDLEFVEIADLISYYTNCELRFWNFLIVL